MKKIIAISILLAIATPAIANDIDDKLSFDFDRYQALGGYFPEYLDESKLDPSPPKPREKGEHHYAPWVPRDYDKDGVIMPRTAISYVRADGTIGIMPLNPTKTVVIKTENTYGY